MGQVGKLARINSLRNLLIAPLTTDDSTSLAYGTAIPLGVESELTFAPQFVTEDLKSTRGTAESDRYVDFLNWSLRHGEINLDAFALALGGQVVADPGTTNDSKQLYFLKKGLSAGYFGIIGQPVTVRGGPMDFYVALLKCQLENMEPVRLGGGWAEVNMSGRGFYTVKDELLFGIATLEKVTDMEFTVVVSDINTFLAGG